MRKELYAVLFAALLVPALYAATAEMRTQPDLVIHSISFGTYAPAVGDTFNVYVTTKNVGSGWAGASTSLLYTMFGDLAYFNIPPLAPAGYSFNTTNFTCNQSGWVYFTALADLNQAVNESNESNNYRQASIYCNEDLPDLTAISLTATQNNLAACLGRNERHVQFGFSVVNEGFATAYNFTDRLRIFGPANKTKDFSVASLPEWDSVNHTMGYCLPVGSYEVYANADWFDVVDETNEGNNAAYLAFSVT